MKRVLMVSGVSVLICLCTCFFPRPLLDGVFKSSLRVRFSSAMSPQFVSRMYEGRSINKLQNGAIP